MKSHLQFITTPATDTPGTSLLLHFDDKRYIVGQIHEGLQRAGLEIGAKFVKVRGILATGKVQWSNVGGLPGLLLTTIEAGRIQQAAKSEKVKETPGSEDSTNEPLKTETPGEKGTPVLQTNRTLPKEDQSSLEEIPSIAIHGGPNIAHVVASARRFIFKESAPVTVKEYDTSKIRHETSTPSFQDTRIQVWALSVAPDTQLASLPEPNDEVQKCENHQRKRSSENQAGPWAPDENHGKRQKTSADQARRETIESMFPTNRMANSMRRLPIKSLRPPFQDIFVKDPLTGTFSIYPGPMPNEGRSIPDIDVWVPCKRLMQHNTTIPSSTPSSISTSYIIKNHTQRGKFLPQKAKSLGLRPGPHYASLANGETVVLPNGDVITPDMVLAPAKAGTGLLILDIPSCEYVLPTLHRPELKDEAIMHGVCGVVWILGSDVHNDIHITKYMSDRPDLAHIVSSPDLCPNNIRLRSAAAESVRRRRIDPLHFPQLQASETVPAESALYQVAERGTKIDLEPIFRVGQSRFKETVPYDEDVLYNDVPERVLSLVPSPERLHHVEQQTTSLPGDDAEIIFLGTGSAAPSQHRNVTGILLLVPGVGSYVFDCGENTLGQLRRMYPEGRVQEILKNLRFIWLSHHHADHHLGAISIIKAWREAVGKQPIFSSDEALGKPAESFQKRLFLLNARHNTGYISEVAMIEDFGYSQLVPLYTRPNATTGTEFQIGDGSGSWQGPLDGDNDLMKGLRAALGLAELRVCWVTHCIGSQAISVTFESGFKFSYSGDARPSKEFAKIGQGSTVLVHEATFDEEMRSHANAKKHSTILEAIAVGKNMGAKRLILTHFSQRHPKLPSMSEVFEEKIVSGDLTNKSATQMDGENRSSETQDQTKAHKHVFSLPHDFPEDACQDLEIANGITERLAPEHSTSDAQGGDMMRIGVAFDYMQTKVRDIALLESFNPAMLEMYAWLEEELKLTRKRRAGSQGPELEIAVEKGVQSYRSPGSKRGKRERQVST